MSKNPFARSEQRQEQLDMNRLMKKAIELSESPTSEEETAQEDMTEELDIELEEEIKRGEIVIIQINAKPRMGKSTVGQKYALKLFNWMKKYKQIESTRQFGMANIARDDQEFTKRMRDYKMVYNVLVTDEDNALEKTGENASVEEAQKNVFSNIQAGRYIHRVCCSPTGTIDPNADIRLEIITRDKGVTYARLYYRLIRADTPMWILLGHVKVDVSDIIKVWETKVKKRFFQWLRYRKEEDERFLQEWARKDWHVMYCVKKYEKMDLMNREGILRPRELDYADIMINVMNSLTNLAKIGILDRKIIRSYVESEFRKKKIPLSIVGASLTSDRVEGILNMYKNITRLKNYQIQLKKKFESGKIELPTYQSQVRQLDESIAEMEKAVDIQVSELRRYKQINEKYNQDMEAIT